MFSSKIIHDKYMYYHNVFLANSDTVAGLQITEVRC